MEEKCLGCNKIVKTTHIIRTQTTVINVCSNCFYRYIAEYKYDYGKVNQGKTYTVKRDEVVEDLLYNVDEIAIIRTIETLKDDLIDWGVWANGTHCAEINIDDVKRITRVVFELERRMKV